MYENMRALLLSCRHSLRDPRPSRMVKILGDLYQKGTIHEIHLFSYEEGTFLKKDLQRGVPYSFLNLMSPSFIEKIIQRVMAILFPKRMAKCFLFFQKNDMNRFKNSTYDLIICHDLVLLPLATFLKKKSKHAFLIFDAREFYPLEFESSFFWRLQFKRLYTFLCQFYLPLCDEVLTVSKGLQGLYEKYFSCGTRLFYSLPLYESLEPSPIDDKCIQLIYHGACNPDRGIHNLIEMMDFLPKSYHLTLILVKGSGSKRYERNLRRIAFTRNVSMIDPFDPSEIVQKTASFDIGLCCFQSTTANLHHSMPNKLFEYIQSRLMVVTTPLHDLSEFVIKEDIGRVTKGFSPKEMAETFLSLSVKDIQRYKKNASLKATVYNYQAQEEEVKKMIASRPSLPFQRTHT